MTQSESGSENIPPQTVTPGQGGMQGTDSGTIPNADIINPFVPNHTEPQIQPEVSQPQVEVNPPAQNVKPTDEVFPPREQQTGTPSEPSESAEEIF